MLRLRKRKTSTRVELLVPVSVVSQRREYLALGAIVRNESNHIAEWLRFYNEAGVSHFYLYDDGSSDGTADVALSTLPSGQVTIIPWQQRLGDSKTELAFSSQTLAYGHCVANFGAGYRWMAMLTSMSFYSRFLLLQYQLL